MQKLKILFQTNINNSLISKESYILIWIMECFVTTLNIIDVCLGQRWDDNLNTHTYLYTKQCCGTIEIHIWAQIWFGEFNKYLFMVKNSFGFRGTFSLKCVSIEYAALNLSLYIRNL